MIRANELTQRQTKHDCVSLKSFQICVVSWEKWSETVHSYKYTSTDRKASNGEMITMFCHQNTAANYVKIITTSKSMSGGELRGGSPTTHSNTSTHTHTLLLILSAVIVRPHARCVSAQELTAWGAGYIAWEWLHESYLESASFLHMQNFMHGGVFIHKHTYTCTPVCFRHGQLRPNFKHISKTLIIATSTWRFCISLTNTHNQKGFIAKTGNTGVCC